MVPADLRTPYDIREVIARMVDGSRFDEFKAAVRRNAGHRFRPCHGMPGRDHRQQWRAVFRGGQGRAFRRAVLSSARSRCCSCRTSPASWSAGNTRTGGIARHGAKMVTAVASTNVPKITMLVGGSFGAGNYGMAGRAYQPRFLWTWPNSRISVMGGEQAAGVLATVKRDAIERGGGDWSAEDEAEFKRPDHRHVRAPVAPAVCQRAAVGRRHHRPAQIPRCAGPVAERRR